MRNVDALRVLVVNMDRINHLTCACACKPLICTAVVTDL